MRSLSGASESDFLITEPPAKVLLVALSGLNPFSFGGRGRPPSNQRNGLMLKPLHYQLEGKRPREPRECQEPTERPNPRLRICRFKRGWP